MPVHWDQLDSIYPTDFTLRTVPDLLEEHGDPWADILSAKQDLAELLGSREAV
jgi:DNA primase